jgi:HK97 gp10 family phage protein
MAGKGLRIDFSGHNELLKNMENLSEEVRNRAKEEASRRAPVDTRKLKDSIIIQTVEDNELVTEAKVGPNKKAFYGMFVEYGTRRVKAQPFLRPAFDENQDKIHEVITEKLGQAIAKAVKDVDTRED